jgi:hypothetical protein
MKYYIALIISLSITISCAQSSPENKTGTWLTYSGNHRISEKISINTYAQIWQYEVGENFNFLLLNTGINYHISSKFTATISYGFTDIDSGYNTNTAHTFENRLYEQITFKHKIKTLPIDHRFRTEQRFFNKPESNKTSHRLRYRIGTKIKLNKNLFIRLNNEILSTIENDINTENRFYSALGINISKSSNIQIGYLNQKKNKLNLHRLQIGIFIKTNHIKKNII